ncbi:hypothetical protein NDU88_003133 [Pleurodeles waltl]|uniref:Uncharacterized protein n=1 Tax=Pleurodeles waltl TaxID=8319 RepID=A0AAV7W553_PLEWA|nr:hypothetical protein NDU88_003133 [Pleurodeles waltl]
MIGTDVRTSSRTSYCLYDVRRRRVRDSDVLVDVQRLVRRFPSNAGAMGVFMSYSVSWSSLRLIRGQRMLKLLQRIPEGNLQAESEENPQERP